MQLLLKVLGTFALAIGFVTLVSRAPFMPVKESSAPSPQRAFPRNPLSLDVNTDLLKAGGIDLADVEPPLGLFKGRFGPSVDSPGFATEEHRVSGVCKDAGARWAREICPTCQLLSNPGAEGEPQMLLWTEARNGRDVTRAVQADCTATGPDGDSVVASVTFDDREATLDAPATRDPSLDVVPLLPGGTRIAALEVGEWLATIDHVGRPSSALVDMAIALRKNGWRDIPSGTEAEPGTFGGQRVLKNEKDATCVISLSRQGDQYQLTTVVSPGRRG